MYWHKFRNWAEQTHFAWYVLFTGIVLPVYLKTILPGLAFWGDSAKFQYIGKVLGTPHQPGYPLYTLLNYVFISAIPKGTLAFRVNLLSTCCMIAALLVFLNLLLYLYRRPWAAFITALIFAFAYSTWLYAIIPEVYGLNLLFMVGVINLLLRWRSTRTDRYFYAACLVYAISFGNHQVMIALLPSFFYLTWITDRRVFLEPRKIAWVIGCVLLGLALYLYIPWRTNDPGTAYLEFDTSGLLAYLRNPGTQIAFRLSLADIFIQRIPVAADLFWKNDLLLLIAAAFGIFQTRDRRLNIFLLLLLATNLFIVIQLDIPEADGMYLPAFLALAIFIGFALAWVLDRLQKNPGLAWFFVLIPVFFLWFNYPKVDQSQHTLHARITEKILSTADSNAVIIADDYEYAQYLWYYLLGEDKQMRNIFALPDYAVTSEQISEYLAGNPSLYIHQQRRTVPPGMRLYVMASVAPKFRESSLILKATDSKYLLEAKLP